ncbi:Sfum_1244 family protein [Thiolapillus sp.]|uniref:Sfum_1244 family protein n=1 Tax=Thiolapillus sp. TaxID=2017437 RepID=UPI003AF5AF36
MNHSLEKIRSQVQHNCHIADARHGGDYTICTYLLKMREFFRWEEGLGFQAPIPAENLGDWLMEREELWEKLGEDEFAAIEIGGRSYDPFDSMGINRALEGSGLVYSAGLASRARANFYLGKLLQHERGEGLCLYISGQEYARCLTAPPAMASDQGVFLRKEALRRYLWEKYESWGWNRPDNALGRAYACYGFSDDAEAALEQMTEVEMASAREHELGEYEASRLLGDGWSEMLLDLALSPAELMARAVKDHLADSLHTLPMLLESGTPAPIHFYIGNLAGMRRHLFPQLLQAYELWQEQDDLSALAQVAGDYLAHWQNLAQDMMAVHRRLGVGSAETLRRLVLDRCGVDL